MNTSGSPLSEFQERFQRALTQFAQAPALATADLSLSYEQLDQASDRLARHLATQVGVRAGDLVPLSFHRTALLVLVEVALLRLGAVAVPIDAASPVQRQALMLSRVQPRVVLTDQGGPALGGFEHLQIEATWLHVPPAGHAPAEGTWQGFAPGSDGTASVMFTSGSTGVPKGVKVPGAGIEHLVRDSAGLRFQAGQRWAFLASPAFDAALMEVWGPLLNGGCCVVLESAAPSLDMLARFLSEQAITDCLLTTSLFNVLVDDDELVPSLQGLSQILIAGERASPGPLAKMLALHPQVTLLNAYGPTENSVLSTVHDIQLADTTSPAGIPIGRPLPSTTIRLDVVDPDPGAAHELLVSGPGLSAGYLQDPERTAQSFVEVDGTRWYRTGDLVRQRPDGVLLFVGRADRQVKIHGQRIELDEVELHLSACPGVKEAVVCLLGDATEHHHLAAIYAGPDATRPDARTLRQHLAERLPLGGVPSRFMGLPTLPKLPNGKIDRKAAEALLSNTHRPGDFWQTLAQSLTTHADRLALETDGQSLSYRALDQRSRALAQLLTQRGIQPGDFVPLLAPRSIELIVAMVAIARCGAAYVPIDLRSPPSRVALILGRVQPKLVLLMRDMAIDGVTDEQKLRLDLIDWSHHEPHDPAWAPRQPRDALYAMFTSGSTGIPKGVVVSGGNLAAFLLDQDWAEFPADARWLLATSPAFDISAVEIWGPLLHGATVVILEGELPSLDEMARLLQDKNVSHAQLAAALFNALVDSHLPSLAGVKQFITGGERASPSHMGRVLDAHPGLALINAYGPTETTVWSTSHVVTRADVSNEAGIPIGQPIRSTTVRLEPYRPERPEDGDELLIGGAGVATGYLGDPEQTARRFVTLDGQRWYRTGDLARRGATGRLEYLGRADRQVKLQGQRIELDEVELVLASCDGVSEAAALLRGSTPQDSHLVAAYVCHVPGTPTPKALTQHALARLPQAAVPRRLLAIDQFPVNTNGKIDRDALSRLIDDASAGATPSPQPAAPLDTAWQSPLEAQLAQVWQVLLPHAAPHREAHFLDQGGTSIMALRLAAMASQRLGRELPPADVLLYPVLKDLAARISQAPLSATTDTSPADHGPNAGPDRAWLTLTRAQTNLLRADQLDATRSAYLVQVPWRLTGVFRPERWQQAFVQLAARHPMLRLRAQAVVDQWQAWVAPELAEGWWTTHAPTQACPPDLDWPATLTDVINRPMQVSTDGVMRVDTWPLSDDSTLLVWTIHHAVIDESSIEMATTELARLLANEPLPPVDGSPTLMQAIESTWVDEAGVADTAQALREALAGTSPPLPRTPTAGVERALPLEAANAQRLGTFARTTSEWVFPVLMCAFGRSLQAVFGGAHRFVATPFSRRMDPGLIDPLHYWLDIRLLEAGARPAESASANLHRLRHDILSAQTRSFRPLDAVIEHLASADPQVAAQVNQFGLTWRKADAHAIQMDGCELTELRVQQCTARYGLFLHATLTAQGMAFSMEAVASAQAQGWVGAVWAEFQAQLGPLLDAALSPVSPMAAPSTPTAPVPTGSTAPHETALKQAWSRWVDCRPGEVDDNSHFFEAGGTSLLVMRMASDLQKTEGLTFEIAQFLQEPTFAHLQRIVQVKAKPLPDHTLLVGQRSAANVVLLLPGAGGQAIGILQLAKAIQAAMGPDHALVIVDVDGLLKTAPLAKATTHVLAHLGSVAHAVGLDRLAGCVGYSLGGLLGMVLANQLDTRPGFHLALLDTYAPRAFSDHVLRRLERKVASVLFGRHRALEAQLAKAEEAALEEVAQRASREQWLALHQELLAYPCRAPLVQLQLIQAEESMAYYGLLWRRQTNGFLTTHFAQWSQVLMAGRHLDLPHRLAEPVAQQIAQAMGLPQVPTP